MLVGYPMYIIGAVSAVENMQVDTEYKYCTGNLGKHCAVENADGCLRDCDGHDLGTISRHGVHPASTHTFVIINVHTEFGAGSPESPRYQPKSLQNHRMTNRLTDQDPL